MRWKPLRLTSPWLKAIAIALFVGLAIGLGLLLPKDSVVASIAQAAVVLAANYGLTRIFRIDAEPQIPARPWWKATGRPTSGFAIGAVSTVGVGAVAVSGFLGLGVGTAVIAALGNLATAVFYLNSSIRLSRAAPDPAPLPRRQTDF